MNLVFISEIIISIFVVSYGIYALIELNIIWPRYHDRMLHERRLKYTCKNDVKDTNVS